MRGLGFKSQEQHPKGKSKLKRPRYQLGFGFQRSWKLRLLLISPCILTKPLKRLCYVVRCHWAWLNWPNVSCANQRILKNLLGKVSNDSCHISALCTAISCGHIRNNSQMSCRSCDPMGENRLEEQTDGGKTFWESRQVKPGIEHPTMQAGVWGPKWTADRTLSKTRERRSRDGHFIKDRKTMGRAWHSRNRSGELTEAH